MLDQIKTDLIAAMKAGEALKVSVLRMLVSAINYKQIDTPQPLTEVEIGTVVAHEAKKRTEAIESYSAAGRTEQADKETAELAILQDYLPKQLSESEITVELAKLELPADFGAAMKIVSPMFRGKADGATVARLVKTLVSK